jgi:hypothetical protein
MLGVAQKRVTIRGADAPGGRMSTRTLLKNVVVTRRARLA